VRGGGSEINCSDPRLLWERIIGRRVGRSRADFIAKLGIVLEEADESQFWLELISEMEILDCTLLCELLNESRQLVAMLTASLNTAKDNKPANRS